MSEEKEKSLIEYRDMIKKSWTYDRMAQEEKDNIMDVLSYNNIQTIEALKGTKKQCWAILQAIYSSFLAALNYKPTGWRETEEEKQDNFIN